MTVSLDSEANAFVITATLEADRAELAAAVQLVSGFIPPHVAWQCEEVYQPGRDCFMVYLPAAVLSSS